MLDFVGRRRWFFLLSALLLIPGIISLLIPPALKLGLEFSPGYSLTVIFREPVAQEGLRARLLALGHEAIVQRTPKVAYLVEMQELTGTERVRLEDELNARLGLERLVEFPLPEKPGQVALGFIFKDAATLDRLENKVPRDRLRAELESLGYPQADPQPAALDAFLIRIRAEGMEAGERDALEAALERDLGPLDSYDFDLVSRIVAIQRVRNAFYAILAASAAILLYITWAFRRVPKPFRWGVCAVVALAHDILMVLGVFSLLGKALGMEIDSLFIAGILTVAGYSVHDTIVVFDRIRENIARAPGRDLETTINSSILETLGRSLNTSITTLLVLLALAILGGVTLRNFVLVLIVGIITGTYSSIFVASPLLVVWERGELGRLWRRLPIPLRSRRGLP